MNEQEQAQGSSDPPAELNLDNSVHVWQAVLDRPVEELEQLRF